jgi:prophage regulatory protein
MRLLKRPDVEAQTGLSKTEIYNRMGRGVFPLPVTLSRKSVAWVSTEVDEWCAAQVSPVEDRVAAMQARGSRVKLSKAAAKAERESA